MAALGLCCCTDRPPGVRGLLLAWLLLWSAAPGCSRSVVVGTGLVAPPPVGSFWTRNQTRVPALAGRFLTRDHQGRRPLPSFYLFAFLVLSSVGIYRCTLMCCIICKYITPFSRGPFCLVNILFTVHIHFYFCFACLKGCIQKILLIRLMSNSILPVFLPGLNSFRPYTEVLSLFPSTLGRGVKEQFDTFASSCPVFSTPSIEEAVFPCCMLLPPFLWTSCPCKCGLFLGSILPLWSVYLFFCQCRTVCIAVALKYSLKSGSVIPQLCLFFLKTVLSIQGLLCFHTNFRIVCSSFVKNAIGIFIRIALTLQIALGSMAILIIQIPSIH